ncbi:MAG: aminotransferase class I/II-fold pyridoxal phosphate-dependent enzyme [Acidobacteriota bacterium]
MRDFELEVYFSAWEFQAKIHMTASDVESMRLSELLALATPEQRSAFDELWLGYTETWGAPDLREAIAATYDTVDPADVVCFAGAEEGIYAAMRVLLSADDHAIVVVPNYQAAETLPLDICDVSGVALHADAGWQLDLDELIAALRPNTRLISLNLPNNPTGALLPHATLEAIVDLCRERGIYLFSDEVFRLLELDASKRLPQVADLYERGLSLNVMSKAYGLPGLRIGWIACRDREVLSQLERAKHYLSICNSAPSERLALIALENRQQILEQKHQLMRSNLAELNAFFADFPDLFDWSPPDGGCIAFPRFRGAGGVETFCRDLINERGVLLLPASVYRSELLPAPTDHFRIGFGRSDIHRGLREMRGFVEQKYRRLQ